MSLQLPRPRREYAVHEDVEVEKVEIPKTNVPVYRNRAGYIPRKPEDHGDGGAFPEIHVAQYPLNMGRKDKSGKGANTLALTVDKEGRVEFDAIVKRGGPSSQKIQTKYEDVVAKNSTAEENSKLLVPTEEEEEETARRTQAIFSSIVKKKVDATRPVQVVDNSASAKSIAVPKYITYESGNGKESRVIRMVEAQKDPLEPPNFKHQKQPRAASTDPLVPVLQAPDEKLSEKEKADWNIPPCISSWKNRNGYTISLDKRLANDGSGLQQIEASDRFAALSEALYVSENQSRQEIEARNREKQFLLKKEKEQRDEDLRLLAAQARIGQQNALATSADSSMSRRRSRSASSEGTASSKSSHGRRSKSPPRRFENSRRGSRDRSTSRDRRMARSDRSETPPPRRERRDRSETPPRRRNTRDRSETPPRRRNVRDRSETPPRSSREPVFGEENAEKLRAAMEREKIRHERKRERERAFRLEAAGKKSKLARDGERDVSERIALGMAVPKTVHAQGEAQYDSRLFNQSGGMGSGFGADDDYNVYDKPLFDRSGDRLYRPKASEESNFGSANAQLEKIKNSDRFSSAKDTESSGRGRSNPVQFERDSANMDFGAFVGATGEIRRPGEKIDHALGKGRTGMGVMGAMGAADLDAARVGSGRTKILFEKGSSS